MRKLCILFLFLVIPLVVYSEELPQPVGWVNDFANVIIPDYKEKINSLADELQQKTTAQVVVVTINSIAPYGEKEYARMLFDNWKPGQKGKDNGVLVLLAVKERRWRIETGYGVEGILPDGVCGDIGRNYLVPYFKQGRYSEGLYYGVAAIADKISGHSAVEMASLKGINPQKRLTTEYPLVEAFALFILTLIIGLGASFVVGLIFTIFCSFLCFLGSPILGFLVIVSFLISLFLRYCCLKGLPSNERRGTFWGSGVGGFGSGDFGGGGFGGFGGGGGGGGGGF